MVYGRYFRECNVASGTSARRRESDTKRRRQDFQVSLNEFFPRSGTSKVVVVNGTEIHLGGGRDTIIAPDGAKPQIVVRPNLFRITRKIRYPAGLSGAVRFVLAPGVPKPEGSPGSSRIVD